MFRKSLFPMIAFAIILVMTACDKDESAIPEDENISIAEDIGLAEYLVENSEDVSEDALELRDGNSTCPEVTFEQPQGTFPNTITIDFGTGCEGPHGHVRSGKILIEQSAPMPESGAVRVTIYENFYVDDVQLTGTKTLTNLGFDENGNVTFERKVENAQLLFPDGSSKSWDALQTRTQIAGGQTPERFDDVFEITGGMSGISRNGIAFSSEITIPLVKSNQCRWVSEGLRELTFGVKSWSIDYSFPDGECDRLALLTLDNGDTKVIKLHRRRW
jgi:hypothetical protein